MEFEAIIDDASEVYYCRPIKSFEINFSEAVTCSSSSVKYQMLEYFLPIQICNNERFYINFDITQLNDKIRY